MRHLWVVILLFSFGLTARDVAPLQLTDGGVKKVVIKTSAICGMCKTTIEDALTRLDGVVKAELDLVTKKVTVRYLAKNVDVATLRQAISAAGYDADDIPARAKAYESLSACCKNPASCSDDEAKH